MKVKTLSEYEIIIKQKFGEEIKIIIMQEKSDDISFMAGEFSFEHRTGRMLFKNKKNVILFKTFPCQLKEMIEKELAALVIIEVDQKTIKTGRGNVYFPVYRKLDPK